MASSAGPISGVGRGVANQLTPGDIVVSRIRGPFEAYVIGRIYAEQPPHRRWVLKQAARGFQGVSGSFD